MRNRRKRRRRRIGIRGKWRELKEMEVEGVRVAAADTV